MAEQDSYERHRFLVENRAVVDPGWLPTAEDVPELGDLRAGHERVLAAQREATAEFMALRAQRNAEEESRRAFNEAHFLGREPKGELPPITVGDEDLLDAKERADAAKDAVQTFAREAIATVREREASLLDGLDEITRAAEAKEAEAAALIAEAAAMKASTLRLKDWLARSTGKSPLGHVAWRAIPLPTPDRAADMTVRELHEATVPAWGAAELASGPAFGTDNPDDLDPDSTAAKPWEVPLHG